MISYKHTQIGYLMLIVTLAVLENGKRDKIHSSLNCNTSQTHHMEYANGGFCAVDGSISIQLVRHHHGLV